MGTPAPNAHVVMMRELLASGDYSDLTITCGSDTYRVHKAIVCKRSGFFERAERFPRPAGQEAGESKVDLPHDEPEIIRLVVQYLYENEYEAESDERCKQKQAAEDLLSQRHPNSYKYNFDFPHKCRYYDHSPATSRYVCPHHLCASHGFQELNFICTVCAPILEAGKADPNMLLLHSQMYEIGEKYNVAGLKVLACEKFSPICEALWDKEVFAEVAEHVLNTTLDSDNGLRDVLSKTIVSHVELLNKPAVAELLNRHTSFMFKVLRHVAEARAGLKPST